MNERRILILYGSQTGTARGMAERVFREAKRFRFRVELRAMDDFRPVGRLLDEKVAAFICSTTGQGDSPSNMINFWKFLLRRNLPSDSLDNLSFGVLGLGDSSYLKFNFVAKRLHKRLLNLGARCIVDLGLADDQHDLGHDATVDPWLENFFRQVLSMMPMPQGVEPIPRGVRPSPSFRMEFGDFRKVEDAKTATLMRNERLTPPDHFQDVRLVEFSMPKGRYDPGDVCVVRPSNLEENVAMFFELFPHLPDPDATFCLDTTDPDLEVPDAIKGPRTIRSCVETVFDLQAVPGRFFL